MKQTIVTADGYTFFVTDDGRVVDNQNPELIDLSWENLAQFTTDVGHYDFTVDFGKAADDMVCTARFEVNNNATYEDGDSVDDYDVVVWAWIANEESSICDEANAVHGITTPAELSDWIESLITEMADDYQTSNWVAKYVLAGFRFGV